MSQEPVGLTHEFLNNFLSTYLPTSFLGVVPCDQLPSSSQHTFGCIVNLSRLDEPGTHFVSILICGPDAYYFDSYGLPRTNPYLSTYRRDLTWRIVNHHQLQSWQSAFCGWFCAAFMLWALHCKKLPMQFSSCFHRNALWLNDYIVTELVKCMIQYKV